MTWHLDKVLLVLQFSIYRQAPPTHAYFGGMATSNTAQSVLAKRYQPCFKGDGPALGYSAEARELGNNAALQCGVRACRLSLLHTGTLGRQGKAVLSI